MSVRVSILMPLRESRFLGPAIKTLLAQTMGDFELVAVDDASDAQTQERLAAHAARDSRIRIIRRDCSEGLAAALNYGINHCSAPLIARADADDVYHPERLARQVTAFDARPKLAALSCGWRRIDETGQALFTRVPVTGPANLRFLVMFMNPLLHPGAMLRADAVREVGGYDAAFWTAQDADLWARMAPRFDIDNLPEPLVDWRRHDASIMAKRGAAGRELSMSVRARQHASYLGEPQPAHLVESSVDLLAAAVPLTLPELSAAERYLAQFLAIARARETPAVVAAFRMATATALAHQSKQALRSVRPDMAMILARRAARWRLGRNIAMASPLLRTRKDVA